MSCSKVCHPTRRHAMRALSSLRRAGDSTPSLGVYECLRHGTQAVWHVGHARYSRAERP